MARQNRCKRQDRDRLWLWFRYSGCRGPVTGAKYAYATDIDPQAVLATKQNAELNGVLDRLYVGLPEEFNTELGEQKADVFVANILAGPLMMLEPEFAELVKPEAEFALAGVIEEQVADVTSIYSKHFDILEVEKRDEHWCRISGNAIRIKESINIYE